MTTNVDVVNRALQVIGTRTTVTTDELADSSTNEAIQANLMFLQTRDDLLRMAPWDCALNYANLVYITSSPGTPENQSPVTPLWEKGQPAPPWTYEFQYPVDCLRACFIVPSNQTGAVDTVPIFPVSTGGAPTVWNVQPVKFKIAVDQFFPVLSSAVASGGTGYAVGDVITAAAGPTDEPPIGAPVKILVTGVTLGVVTTAIPVNQIRGEVIMGGSYFEVQSNPVSQGSTTGSGTGATFNLTYGSKGDQRVILCNQEYPTLAYCKQITDPNVMDTIFQDAWVNYLASKLAMALTGDKQIANMCIQRTNAIIAEARKADGNEGLTINNFTPDWLRVRGVADPQWAVGPWNNFDWGPFLPAY